MPRKKGEALQYTDEDLLKALAEVKNANSSLTLFDAGLARFGQPIFRCSLKYTYTTC